MKVISKAVKNKIKKPVKFYDQEEEKLNIITHALGVVLSIVALVLLVVYAAKTGTVWHVVSFSIFGSSLILLYSASTIYHSSKNPKWREKLNIIDHSAIYVLIAGTYTPFCLVTLKRNYRLGDFRNFLGNCFSRYCTQTFLYWKI